MSDPHIYPQIPNWPPGRPPPRLIRDDPLDLPPPVWPKSCRVLIWTNIILAALLAVTIGANVMRHKCLVAMFYVEHEGIVCELVNQVTLR